MKKMQKGFTLVELIVVITILAILGTIAFISLQGYSQDARDSKVTSDVRSLASAIETAIAQEGVLASEYNLGGNTSNTVTISSGSTTIAGDAIVSTGSSVYSVGDIDFVTLKQNDSDFGPQTYLIGTLSDVIGTGEDTESYNMYQIVGAKGIDGQQVAVVKGNFIPGTGANGLGGLVSATGSANTDAIANDLPIEGGSLK